jgi:hypothetical protein
LKAFANTIFVICLTAWLLLALEIGVTIMSQGWGGVAPKLVHLGGMTPDLRTHSLGFVISRLAGLFAITVVAAFLRRPK